MISNTSQLQVTLEQIGRVIRALDDLKETTLEQNPQLFSTMAEGYIDDLDRLRGEVEEFLLTSKSAG